jgi:hypothetical protein
MGFKVGETLRKLSKRVCGGEGGGLSLSEWGIVVQFSIVHL